MAATLAATDSQILAASMTATRAAAAEEVSPTKAAADNYVSMDEIREFRTSMSARHGLTCTPIHFSAQRKRFFCVVR